MRKALLSIGLVAASASYVGLQNHVLDVMQPGGQVASVSAVAEGPDLTDLLATPAEAAQTEAAPATPLALGTIVTEPSPAPSVAEITPPVVVPLVVTPPIASVEPTAPLSSEQPVVVANSAPVVTLPPIPRPRPHAADVALQSAQAIALAAPSGPYRDGTYKGTSENAYYGRVQVQITVAGNYIAKVDVLSYPSDRRTSRYINAQALPILQSEVMRAQDASVDGVSGATLTSRAYIRSLGKAVAQARGSNA